MKNRVPCLAPLSFFCAGTGVEDDRSTIAPSLGRAGSKIVQETKPVRRSLEDPEGVQLR
jgi:hypothetical protein